jgi:uncharacterized membrane protein
MQLSFLVTEFVVLSLGVLMAFHAHQRGTRWLSTYLCGILFATLVELLIVRSADPGKLHYVYGEFVFMLRWGSAAVPLWVGVGWGLIVYVAVFTAQRFRSPWWLRPLHAGVLAVNVDLSLDPIAEQLGFWKWHNVNPLNFHGVPFDNFLGWMLIVSSFALCTRYAFRLVPRTAPGRDLWIPPLGAVLALALTRAVQLSIDRIYPLLSEFVVFILVFLLAGVITVGLGLKSRRDNPKDLLVLSVPLVMHGLMLTLVFAADVYRHQPSLVVTLPLAMLVGFFGFSWSSLESLFPLPPGVPPSAPSSTPASAATPDLALASPAP